MVPCNIPKSLANLVKNDFARHVLLEDNSLTLLELLSLRTGLSIIPETSKRGSLLATLLMLRVFRD